MSKIDVEHMGQENLHPQSNNNVNYVRRNRLTRKRDVPNQPMKQHGHLLVVLQHLMEALQVHRVPTSEDRRLSQRVKQVLPCWLVSQNQ